MKLFVVKIEHKLPKYFLDEAAARNYFETVSGKRTFECQWINESEVDKILSAMAWSYK